MTADEMTVTIEPVLFEVWRLVAGVWYRAGRYGSRAEAEGAIPERGAQPGWAVLPVSAGFAARRGALTVTATNDEAAG